MTFIGARKQNASGLRKEMEILNFSTMWQMGKIGKASFLDYALAAIKEEAIRFFTKFYLRDVGDCLIIDNLFPTSLEVSNYC